MIKGTRKQKLTAKGREIFCNPSEDAVAVFMRDNKIYCSKRGYPDFTIYNKDGSIYGFIEVKPRDDRFLKVEQKTFSEFCHQREIPFLKWSPKDGIEPLQNFIPSEPMQWQNNGANEKQ